MGNVNFGTVVHHVWRGTTETFWIDLDDGRIAIRIVPIDSPELVHLNLGDRVRCIGHEQRGGMTIVQHTEPTDMPAPRGPITSWVVLPGEQPSNPEDACVVGSI